MSSSTHDYHDFLGPVVIVYVSYYNLYETCASRQCATVPSCTYLFKLKDIVIPEGHLVQIIQEFSR